MIGLTVEAVLLLMLVKEIGGTCPILNDTIFACHGKLETAKEILEHLPHLLPNTTTLDFSRNSISKLEQDEFRSVTAVLLTLNVSHNQIASVAVGAFAGISELRVLDLSFNQLRIISLGSFQGLPKLQKLLLSNNPITQVEERSLDVFPSLTQLDISGSPLMCDCHLAWLSDRLRQRKLSLLQDAATTCFTPILTRGRRFTSLQRNEFICNESSAVELHRLDIWPSRDQIVVAGDNLSMECWATNVLGGGGTHLVWSLGDSGLPANVSVEIRESDDKGLVIGRLNITQLSAQHNGNWRCFAYTAYHNQTTTRRIQVLDPVGVKCPTNHTVTTRGSFYWPETLALGQVLTIPCDQDQEGSPLASHVCGVDGRWQGLNVSQCELRSEFARVMGEYVARIGSQVSAESASLVPAILKTYLLTETTARVILDADYVDLVLQALENIVSHAEGSTKAGLHNDVLPIISWLLNTSYLIVEEGQERLNLSQRIVHLVLSTSSLMTETAPTSLKNFALNVVQVRRGEEILCQVITEEVTKLECSANTDKTDPDSLAKNSIRISKDDGWEGKALILAFRNVKIFAATLDKSRTPASMVLGVFPVQNRPGSAQRKWTVKLQTSGLSDHTSPFAFSEQMAEMTGNCSEVERKEESQFVLVECKNLGAFVTITQPLEVFLAHHSGSSRSTGVVPLLIFIGCVVAIIVHLSLLFLYAIYFSSMVLDRVYKHSLLNTWTAVLALLLLYSTAFNYSPHPAITTIVAFVLYYFALTTVTWILLGFYTIFRHHRAAIARQKTGYSPQRVAAMQGLLLERGGGSEVDVEEGRPRPDMESAQGLKARVGLGGLYLFGWGTPVLFTCLAAFLHTHADVYLFLVPIAVFSLSSFILYLFIVSSSRNRQKGGLFDGGKLGYSYHATVLLLYLLLFLASLTLAALPYWLKEFTPSLYMVLAFVVAWSVEAMVMFWLVRNDLPKTCWDATKKSQAEENAARTVIPLQHTVYAPLSSQAASVFQDGRMTAMEGSGGTRSLYENVRGGLQQQRAAPSLADSNRLTSSFHVPAQVPHIETRI